MGFEVGRRTGLLWEDVQLLDELISSFSFNLSNKNERDFENSLSSHLMSNKERFKNTVMSQIDRDTTVESAYCFGKKHRPDMAVNNNGIAIEVKYINDSLDGFKYSIGQGYLYRLKYKFVVVVLIIAERHRTLYEKIINNEEKDLEDIIKSLAENLNIFTYIVPAFKLKSNQKKILSAIEKISN